MSPTDIRDVRRKRARTICGAQVPASTYRRAGPCQRRIGLRGGRCWIHRKPLIKGRK